MQTLPNLKSIAITPKRSFYFGYKLQSPKIHSRLSRTDNAS